MSSDVILRTTGVVKKFGDFTAVGGVDYALHDGEAAGIIGPNGAGKSTFFNLMTGLHRPTSGRVELFGRDVTAMSAHHRVSQGMVRTFQLVSVFDDMSVLENMVLSVVRFSAEASGLRHFMFGDARKRGTANACRAALDRVGIGAIASNPVASLSYGDKRRLEIAMSLSLNPRILLLDEPLAGLSDGEITEVLDLIRDVSKTLTLVIIEHKISRIVDLVGRLSVMCEGRKLAEGAPHQVLNDPEVRRVYWGEKGAGESAAIR